MRIFKKILFIGLSVFFLLIGLFILVKAESISGISISPALDVSYFSHYHISADISGSSTSANLAIPGVNGDGGSYWNYYASGTPFSDMPTKSMSYDASSSQWISENVFPDSIYPEIFFAPSSITWINAPLNTSIRTNSYQLLHFYNSFSMRASSSFFIEINAAPRSLTQSTDLQVYLVRKGKTITFFQSDWRLSPDVELVGTINRGMSYHHSHSADSAHFLLPLVANADGTIGINNLDISGDFWIILYSNSPSNIRGWNLRYQPASLCNAGSLWQVGNQSSWTTAVQSGCPDMHVHFARRGLNSDGVNALVTANYVDGSTATSSTYFYFDPLPNLPPNSTSFTNPISAGVYNGGIGVEKINITWDPASDPNLGDSLNYTIYLMDAGGATSSTLVAMTSNTNYLWDISAVPNGDYGLKGVVCDNNASPLCREFSLSRNFTIAKVAPIYSLSSISLTSDNATSTSARAGNTVTLSFTSTGALSTTTSVTFYSGGDPIAGPANISNVGNNWTASFQVSAADSIGDVGFIIDAANLDREYLHTTDLSAVAVFRQTLAYYAGANGSLTGSTTQSVAYGEDGVEVTAVADSGYYFTGWSDGVLTASRMDLHVAGDISVTAFFAASPATVPSASTPAVSGSPAVLPGSVGEGSVDDTIPMGRDLDIGPLDVGGHNIMAYIDSEARFEAVVSKTSLVKKYALYISAVNLLDNIVTMTIGSDLQEFSLRLGETVEIDLNQDDIPDISVRFVNVYINRVELTVKSLAVEKTVAPSIDSVFREISQQFIFNLNLAFGSVSADVRELQRYLNANGYVLAENGWGSPGKETIYFGPLTRRALILFQRANLISPAIGYFGPITRKFINERQD